LIAFIYSGQINDDDDDDDDDDDYDLPFVHECNLLYEAGGPNAVKEK